MEKPKFIFISKKKSNNCIVTFKKFGSKYPNRNVLHIKKNLIMLIFFATVIRYPSCCFWMSEKTYNLSTTNNEANKEAIL